MNNYLVTIEVVGTLNNYIHLVQCDGFVEHNYTARELIAEFVGSTPDRIIDCGEYQYDVSCIYQGQPLRVGEIQSVSDEEASVLKKYIGGNNER